MDRSNYSRIISTGIWVEVVDSNLCTTLFSNDYFWDSIVDINVYFLLLSRNEYNNL